MKYFFQKKKKKMDAFQNQLKRNKFFDKGSMDLTLSELTNEMNELLNIF
jgi:hypothetical protein